MKTPRSTPGVRRGGALVSVRPAKDADRATAERILNGRGGVDAAARGAIYREAGWRGFDPAAKPYSADDVISERSRLAETRSFARTEEQDSVDRGFEDKGGQPGAGSRPIDPTLR